MTNLSPTRPIWLGARKQVKPSSSILLATHIHADYVSGSRELAEATGGTLYLSDEGPEAWKYEFVKEYSHQLLKDGDEIRVGKILLSVIHTPGHTPESLSFILTDQGGGADEPMGIFTGDFVFVGSTGRPDLLEEAVGISGAAEAGARDMFRSIERFNQLPDFLQVWPAHGAGSACGKDLGSIPSSTVGYEKRFNAALQFTDESEFVDYILAEQPEAPPYFALMKQVNKQGPAVIGNQQPKQVPVAQLDSIKQAHMVVDVASFDQFASQHVPGTINFPLKYLASEGGWLLDYKQPVYLIGAGEKLREAVRIMQAIGVDNIGGFFDPEDVMAAGYATESYENNSASELATKLAAGAVRLIDVRRQTEWNEGRIEGAEHMFLGRLLEFVDALKADTTNRPIALQCRVGNRSAVASSLLQAAGIKNVVNLKGGIEQWQVEGHAVVTESEVAKL